MTGLDTKKDAVKGLASLPLNDRTCRGTLVGYREYSEFHTEREKCEESHLVH